MPDIASHRICRGQRGHLKWAKKNNIELADQRPTPDALAGRWTRVRAVGGVWSAVG
jgi:hypothetical protein